MPQTDAQKEFEALLAPVLGIAYGTALNLTHNRDDARDLVQDAALQAFRAFDSFQRGTNFKAWFLRVLTNLFLNRLRKQKREPQTAPLEDAQELYLYASTQREGIHGTEADPAELILSKIDVEQMVAAIAALPEDFRVVSALYFMEELSYQEIAEIMDTPVGTVRSRLHRSRRLLQKALWEIAEAQGIVSAIQEEKRGK
jgi:RNA polymerase sigma-70 factor (ECF subfamily)